MKLRIKLNEPIGFLSQPERRRARVLSLIQLTLITVLFILLFVVAVANFQTAPRLILYLVIVVVMLVGLSAAYILNRIEKYLWSAALTVFCAFAGPWLAILFDPTILEKDFIPLVYLSLSILLCSLFLTSRLTILLTFIQSTGILMLIIMDPHLQVINWPSLFAFIFIISIVGIIAGIVTENDLKQIDKQTEQLSEMAIRDPLTGLFNRRYLDEMLQREVIRCNRRQLPIGIIVIDIDHFKHINDSHGHIVGDSVLRDAALFMCKHIRESDIACRFGGDEFILALPEASLEVTTERAENIRQEIGGSLFRDGVVEFIPITISVGVAAYPMEESTIEDVIKMADDALYEAKRNGRNQVVCKPS